MEQTLLLNATYEPLKVVDWRKAITLLWQGKVEVISEYDREIRSVSVTFRLPSVIRLLHYIRITRRMDYVPFSRANIYARDGHRCQYCGAEFPVGDLTFDTSCRLWGGRKDWENIVTSVRTLQPEGRVAGPRRGRHACMLGSLAATAVPRCLRLNLPVLPTLPDSWRDYLYWNVELDGNVARPCGRECRHERVRRRGRSA